MDPEHAAESSTRSTILGLVHENGVAGVRRGPNGQWHLVLRFMAWRAPGEEAVVADRRCEMPASQTELDDGMKRIHGYDVVEVEIADEPDPNATRVSRLVRIGVEDPELGRIADRMRTPLEITHDVFGELRYDRGFRLFAGSATWNGNPVSLSLEDAVPDDPTPVLEAAWRARADEYLVKQLLDLKNDVWLQEDEEEVSASEFLSRIEIESITIRASGEFELWYECGDLFWGHGITVRGSLTEGLKEATLVG